MLSNTFHFENPYPWGICSCAVCVVLDKVPSRGLAFAWHSLLGVGVSRLVSISKIFYVAKCAPLYTFCVILWKNYCATLRYINRWILLNHGWNSHRLYSFVRFESRGWLYVSNIFEHFEPVSFVFCAASFILRPVSFMFRPSLSVFKQYELGAIFFLLQTHLLEISFLNVPSAISRRSQFVLVLISVSVHVRPSFGHHHHTIQWFDYPWLSSGFGAVRTGAMGKELQSGLANILNQ